jgi:protein-L-isoaspartate(D-aspartate) O-methyltransferase
VRTTGLAGAWREAFEQTPRHLFLPQVPVEDAYVNDAVVIQQRHAEITGGGQLVLATSSASEPGVVATMLDRLEARPGMRVLEIGTGTGYNTALLCHRLGDRNVASIDIDPELVDNARAVLATLSYAPTLAAGDGNHGLPDGAPYDAILATCAVAHIPPAWIDQLTGSGRIVAPAVGPGHGLLILTKTAPDEVTGRFDSSHAAFMPLRDRPDNPLAPGRTLGFDRRIPYYGTTDVDPRIVADADRDLLLFLQLHLPGLEVGVVERERELTVNLTVPGSYADVRLAATTPGRWLTIQRGPRRPWDTIEHAARRWAELDKPARDRYGITALTDADRQYVWLDDPDGPYSWPMPL